MLSLIVILVNKESTSHETYSLSSSNGGCSLICEAKLCVSLIWYSFFGIHFDTMVSGSLIVPLQHNYKSI